MVCHLSLGMCLVLLVPERREVEVVYGVKGFEEVEVTITSIPYKTSSKPHQNLNLAKNLKPQLHP